MTISTSGRCFTFHPHQNRRRPVGVSPRLIMVQEAVTSAESGRRVMQYLWSKWRGFMVPNGYRCIFNRIP